MPDLAAVWDLGSHVRLRAWRHAGRETGFFPAAAHPHVEVAFADEGATRYRVGAREETLEPGAVVVVPRGVEHRNAFDASLSGVGVCVSAAMVDEIADAMGARGRALAFGLVRSARAFALARLLADEARAADGGRLLAGEAIAEALVVELLRGAPAARAAGPRDARVRAALERMRASYAEELSVDDLAKSAGMSRFHFSRLFREEVGDAPYKHLLKLRVARAAELLRGGRHTVTEAALAVGFRDMSRFARAFRAELGQSPSELRRARSA